jgi:uroporphyrinogen decarboxylase
MSLDTREKNIRPHHRRLDDAIHRYGASVIYHSDGAVMDVVPGLIDMGIDVLQALQFDAEKMDANVLKGRDGGYILGPSHLIQAGTPARNVLTMFETALEARSA